MILPSRCAKLVPDVGQIHAVPSIGERVLKMHSASESTESEIAACPAEPDRWATIILSEKRGVPSTQYPVPSTNPDHRALGDKQFGFFELNNVSKNYVSGKKRREVLWNIGLHIEESEFVVIVGFSGSGKSTLISLIAAYAVADASADFRNRPV